MNIIDVGLKFAGTLTKRTSTAEIILHHAAGDGDVKSIHNWHINGNGWLGIAYHFYIRKDGKIYRGRPEEMVGGHTYGMNSNTIGICCEGNFEKEYMSPAQKDACGELVGYLLEKYPSVYKVSKHKEHNATACPGKNFPFEDIIAIAGAYAIEEEEEYEIPEATQSGTAGERLELKNEPLYISAYDAQPVDYKTGTYYLWDNKVINGKIKITNAAKRVGKAGQVTGWINEPNGDNVAKEETPRKGDTVRLKKGAKTYTGGSLASFVYERDHIIKELNNDRAVITYGGVVVAAVNVKDLTLA